MFDIGWTELLLIAIVAIVVVGPRDLPRLMRTVGQYTSKLKSMSRELKSQFDQAVREAELDDVGKSLTDLNKMADPMRQIRDAVTKPVAELKSAVADAGRIGDGQTTETASGDGGEGAEPAAEAQAQPDGVVAPEGEAELKQSDAASELEPEPEPELELEPEPTRVVSGP